MNGCLVMYIEKDVALMIDNKDIMQKYEILYKAIIKIYVFKIFYIFIFVMLIFFKCSFILNFI